jgi:murein DD-endopeptidase MepM/ murein hydrolase activator NlpD
MGGIRSEVGFTLVMGNNKPWEVGSHEKSSYLRVRLLLGGKGVTFSIPPVLIVLVLLCGFSTYKLANTQALSEQQRQASKIADLEFKNEQLQSFLDHKERERGQMVSLAEARSKELWTELEDRDQEISRLWKIVGEKPAMAVQRSSRTRMSLVGSRGGERRTALAVKVGYSELSNEFEQKEKEVESLSKAAQAYRQRKVDAYRAEKASRTPSIWPCKGELTSKFGNRIHPVYGYGRFHGGCDFTTPYGTSIQATAAGVVSHADWLGGYGKVVEIDHGNGLKTLYAHCSELSVKKGQKVKKGQSIAQVGTTGLSSGPHCHYEVRRGNKQIDPSPYLKQKDAPKPIAKL